jgi:SOS regulatory protein LexA
MKKLNEILQIEFDSRGWKTFQTQSEKTGIGYHHLRKFMQGGSVPSDDLVIQIADKLWDKGNPERDRNTFELLAAASRDRAKGAAAVARLESIYSNVCSIMANSEGKGDSPQPEEESGVLWIPLIGRVPAGIPIEAIQELAEDRIPVPKEFITQNHTKCFGLRVVGESMVPRIQDGDIAVVCQEAEYVSGDVVVARVDDEEGVTVKRFHQANNVVTLIPENPAFAPMVFNLLDPANRIRILGKVVWLMRRP